MEMGEAVALNVAKFASEKDPTCSKNDRDPGWTSKLNEHGTNKGCSGKSLYNNMWADRVAHLSAGLGVVPPRGEETEWSLANVTPERFPVQAHHLIPKNFLPDHRVCVWLAKGYSRNAEYQLRYDSGYSNDHANNGYCMPYATPMAEWKHGSMSHTDVAFAVMDATEIQLHQGSHAEVLNARNLEEISGRPVSPQVRDLPRDGASCEYTEANSHYPGYLDRVGRLLNVVDAKALQHASTCEVCRARSKGDKKHVLPTKGVTELMDRASKIIKVLIDTNVAHVSGYAYCHAHARKKLRFEDGKIVLTGTPL